MIAAQHNVLVHLRLRINVTDARPNAALSDSIFTFTPPPGATQKRSVAELLKGK